MMDAKTINKFPIREYLVGQGIHPAKERGYYGFYHSPLREDRTPSMKVDYDKNLWIDYGAGEGGTLIDLVMRMERCDAGEAQSDGSTESRVPELFRPLRSLSVAQRSERLPAQLLSRERVQTLARSQIVTSSGMSPAPSPTHSAAARPRLFLRGKAIAY